jgi:Icc-related predicted phosphoesterase
MSHIRLAAIYDIHANHAALEAVLQEIQRAKVDQIVAGGDEVPRPLTRETLACLRDIGIPIQFIYGNGEALFQWARPEAKSHDRM